MKTKILLLFVVLAVACFGSCKDFPENNPYDPTNPDNIAQIIIDSVYSESGVVKVNSTITYAGRSKITNHGLCYSAVDIPDFTQEIYNRGNADGEYSFVSEFRELESGNTYYFKAFVINEADTTLSEMKHIKIFNDYKFSLGKVVEDTNLNDTIDNNETVYLELLLADYGNSFQNTTKVKFSVDNQFVKSFFPHELYWQNVTNMPNLGIYGKSPINNQNYSLALELDNNITAGTVIKIFTETVVNEEVKNDTINITVAAPNFEFISGEIINDFDSDGIINIGECATMKLIYSNNGNGTAYAINTTVNALNTNEITTIEPAAFDAINIWKNSFYIIESEICITPLTPNSASAVAIRIEDGTAHFWQNPFFVQIGQPNLILEKYELIADSNNDGIINPGEEITIKVFIANNSNAIIAEPDFLINTNSSYIQYITPSSFNHISIPANESSTFDLVVKIYSDIPKTDATLNFTATDKFGIQWQHSIILNIAEN